MRIAFLLQLLAYSSEDDDDITTTTTAEPTLDIPDPADFALPGGVNGTNVTSLFA